MAGPREELTTAMHGEFTVTAAIDKQHVIETAREVIAEKLLTKAEALATYGLTETDLAG